MKKKIVSILLLVSILMSVVALTGCNGGGNPVQQF